MNSLEKGLRILEIKLEPLGRASLKIYTPTNKVATRKTIIASYSAITIL